MSKVNTITINLDVTKNGVNCVKPIITIFNSDIIAFPCGKFVKNGVLKLSIPSDLFGQNSCIEGYVQCEECDRCGDKPFKICLCDSNDDCDSCGECINGICTTIECAEDDDCGSGYKCRNCKCNCDGHTDKYGNCVDCTDDSQCKDCEVCVGGDCVPKDCGDGVCLDDECVDCINSGDCDGVNECCVNNECQCCPGFQYNPATKKCEPIAPCTGDEDCPECMVCVNGECVPQICPEGYECVDGNCVYNPCPDIQCDNGLDCSDECGCLNGECIDCLNNSTALGCEPNCDTPCSSGADCDPGCGCVDGKCVSCSNFGCPECDGIDGCKCDGGECVDDDSCSDELDFFKDGCNLKAELKLSKPCQCEAISGSIESTSFGILTIPDPNTSDEPGQIGLKIVNGETYIADFYVDIRNGFETEFLPHKDLPLFTNSNINNELPISGKAVLEIRAVYNNISLDEFGNLVIVQSVGAKSTTDQTLIEKSDAVFTKVTIGKNTLDSNGLGRQIIGYKIDAYVIELGFESNCEYEKSYLYQSGDIVEPLYSSLISVGELRSNSQKNPLFTFTRDGVVFRKLFIQGTGLLYNNILYGPKLFANDDERGIQNLVTPQGEVIPLKQYKIEVDCGCDKSETIDNLTICDIEFVRDTHFVITNTLECNDTLNIFSQFDVCPLNQELAYFGWTGNDLLSQTKYILKVNGDIVEIFVYKNTSDTTGYLVGETSGTTFYNFVKTFSEPITSVSLEQNHDASCIISNTIDSTLITPDINTDCLLGVPSLTFIGNPNSPIVSVDAKGQTFVAVNNIVNITGLVSGQIVNYLITFEDGCTERGSITMQDCCIGETIIGTIVPASVLAKNQELYTVTIVASSGSPLLNIEVNGSDANISNESVNPTTGVTTFTYLGEVPITVTATTEAGCNLLTVLTTDDVTTGSLTIEPSIICDGETSSILLTDTGFSNVPFKIVHELGSEYFGTTNASGDASLAVTLEGTYELVEFNSEIITDAEVILIVNEPPSITNLSSTPTTCTGENVVVTATGSDATVTVTDGTTTQTISIVAGSGSTTFVYSMDGTYNYTIAGTTNGSCVGDSGLTSQTIVSQSPVIVVNETPCLTGNIEYNIVGTVTTGAILTSTSGTVVLVGSDFSIQNIPVGTDVTLEATIATCSTDVFVESPTCTCIIPTFVLNDSGRICEGSQLFSEDLSITVSGTSTYTVNVRKDSLVGTIIATQSGSFINITVSDLTALAVVGQVIWVETIDDNDAGCNRQDLINPIVDAIPDVTIVTPVNPPSVGQPYTAIATVVGAYTSIEWTVTGPNGVVSTTTTVDSVTFTPDIDGNFTIEAVVSYGVGCVVVESVIVAADNNCDLAVILNTAGNCENLIASTIGGTAPFSYEWSIDAVIVNGQTTNIFDTSNVEAGETVTVEVGVTDSSGCPQIIESVSYTRCACLCDENGVCKTIITKDEGTDGEGLVFTSGAFPAGKILEFRTITHTNGLSLSDRYVIKVVNGGTTTLVDTGYPYSSGSAIGCPATNGLPIVDLSAYASGDDVTVEMPIALIPVILDSKSVTVLVSNYTTNAGDVITITHNDPECGSQGAWTAQVKCTN